MADEETKTVVEGGEAVDESTKADAETTDTPDKDTVETDDTTETSDSDGENKVDDDSVDEDQKKKDFDAARNEAKKAKERNAEIEGFAQLGALAMEIAKRDPVMQKKLDKVLTSVKNGQDVSEALDSLKDIVEEGTDNETATDTKKPLSIEDLPPELQTLAKKERETQEKKQAEVKDAWESAEESDPEFKNADKQVRDAVANYAGSLYRTGTPIKDAMNQAVNLIVHKKVVDTSSEDRDLDRSISTGAAAAGSNQSSQAPAKGRDARMWKAAAEASNATNGRVSQEKAYKLMEAGALNPADYE